MEERHLSAPEASGAGKGEKLCPGDCFGCPGLQEIAASREQFIEQMEERGYRVDWQDNHKYITFTDLARKRQERKPVRSGTTN